MASPSWAYPALMVGSLAAGAAASRLQGAELQLDGRQKAALGLGAFGGAMLAAKLPYVLASGLPLWEAAAWHTPGKTILAGLAGGYLGVEAAKSLAGVSVKTGDWFAVPAAAAALWRLRAAGAFRLQLMKLYVVAYAGYRFLTEFVRPEDRMLLGLTAYQFGALALIALFSGLWLRDAEARA